MSINLWHTLFFVMRKWVLPILILLVVACKKSTSDQQVESVKQDSLASCSSIPDSLQLAKDSFLISKDSVLLSLSFVDSKHSIIKPAHPFELWVGEEDFFEFYPAYADSLKFLCPLNKKIELIAGRDTHSITLPTKGGVECLKTFLLDDWLALRGRIMDLEGVPHQGMPIKLHIQYKKRERNADYSQDISFVTDSLGYYTVTIPSQARKVVLRCCGFLVGEISKSEWLNYPTHNFLFNPFQVENLCGDSIPEGEFSIIVPSESGWEEPEFVYLNTFDWKDFFTSCERLEEVDLIAIQCDMSTQVQTKKIRKRNAYFRDPTLRICLKK